MSTPTSEKCCTKCDRPLVYMEDNYRGQAGYAGWRLDCTCWDGGAVFGTPRQASGTEMKGLRLKSTGHSSQRLGPCQICAEHVSEVFMRRTPDFRDYVFGHERCLVESLV